MKHLILFLALGLSTAFGYRDSIPSAWRANPVIAKDPIQLSVLNGTFQAVSEVAYSPVFDLSEVVIYRGFDSTGALKEDSTFGQLRFMGYDISDSATGSVVDSVNVQLIVQGSDYSPCGNPVKCPELSDPWYTVFTDTIKDVSAASAKVEKQRSLSAATLRTARFMRIKATELSTAAQNIPRVVGEWHRKKRVQ